MRNTFCLAHLHLLLLPATILSFIFSSFTAAGSLPFVTMDLDGTLNCPNDSPKNSYCAGDSNTTEFIIHCNEGRAAMSACSLDLYAIEPAGPKLGAICYQESNTSGDAICVYDGKEYDTFEWEVSHAVQSVTGTATNAVTVPTSVDDIDDLAGYIMEGLGLRQHGED